MALVVLNSYFWRCLLVYHWMTSPSRCFELKWIDNFFMQTEPGLHLLMTFHNLSAPYTVDCAGAYVEIEREGNGFEARWCGNPIGQVRIHIRDSDNEDIYTWFINSNVECAPTWYSQDPRWECRSSTTDRCSRRRWRTRRAPDTWWNHFRRPVSLPTLRVISLKRHISNFLYLTVHLISVIDLHDAGQYTAFQRSQAYSSVNRRIG